MSAKKNARRRTPALIRAGAHEEGLIRLYPYQEEDLGSSYRTQFSMQARQTGKTFGISVEAIKVGMEKRRARCVTLSASLNQGALNIQKDAEVWRTVMELMRQRVGQDSQLPEKDRRLFTSPADDDKGRLLDIDAISDLMENGKLVSRIFWGNAASDYSSHQIFAANPETARGATADFLALDEFGTVADFVEVVRAVKHMISRRPQARFKIKGTPPITSNHGSWEMLYNEQTFTPNPRGNWLTTNARTDQGEQGIPILRVDAYDAELAGVRSYDDVTGAPISVDEIMEKATDKEGEERERLLLFKSSGNAKVPYSCLKQAQSIPDGAGELYDLGVLSDLNSLSEEGLKTELRNRVPRDWTRHCTPGDYIGFGHDQSTSDKQGTSNPSVLSVIQEAGTRRHKRLVVRWLSKFPRVNEALLEMILLDARRAGLYLRGLGIDASNEVFHALRLQGLFSYILRVTLYKNGEKHPKKDSLWKDHLADQYAALFLGGLISLPSGGNGKSGEWLLSDHSLAVQTGSGVDWKTSKGNHADTFAAGMLAEEQLATRVGPITVDFVPLGLGNKPGYIDDDDDGWVVPRLPGNRQAF